MSNVKISYTGDIPSQTLYDMAYNNGWRPDPEKTDPENYADAIDFAVLQVLGALFIDVTTNQSCLPYKPDIPPKDYPAYYENTKETILSSVIVKADDKQLYPPIIP
jgi:hypothetical protein